MPESLKSLTDAQLLERIPANSNPAAVAHAELSRRLAELRKQVDAQADQIASNGAGFSELTAALQVSIPAAPEIKDYDWEALVSAAKEAGELQSMVAGMKREWRNRNFKSEDVTVPINEKEARDWATAFPDVYCIESRLVSDWSEAPQSAKEQQK